MKKYVAYSITNYYLKEIEVPDNATEDFVEFRVSELTTQWSRADHDSLGQEYDYQLLAYSSEKEEMLDLLYPM